MRNDVARAVSLDANNQAKIFIESGELLRDLLSIFLIFAITRLCYSWNGFTLRILIISDLFPH
jgi:hypothetical protein